MLFEANNTLFYSLFLVEQSVIFNYSPECQIFVHIQYSSWKPFRIMRRFKVFNAKTSFLSPLGTVPTISIVLHFIELQSRLFHDGCPLNLILLGVRNYQKKRGCLRFPGTKFNPCCSSSNV